MLVNPAGSDKIVRPRLAAPLFSMHTFYQLRLQQQLCKPLLIPSGEFHRLCHQARSSFCLEFGLPLHPVPWTRAQPARLRLVQRLCSHKLFPTRSVQRLRDSHQITFAALFEAHQGCSRLIFLNRLPDNVQSAALAKPRRRRRRTRRRASQELNQEAGTYRTAWMVMNF